MLRILLPQNIQNSKIHQNTFFFVLRESQTAISEVWVLLNRLESHVNRQYLERNIFNWLVGYDAKVEGKDVWSTCHVKPGGTWLNDEMFEGMLLWSKSLNNSGLRIKLTQSCSISDFGHNWKTPPVLNASIHFAGGMYNHYVTIWLNWKDSKQTLSHLSSRWPVGWVWVESKWRIKDGRGFGCPVDALNHFLGVFFWGGFTSAPLAQHQATSSWIVEAKGMTFKFVVLPFE